MSLRFEADLEMTSEGRRTTVTADPDGHLVVTTDEVTALLAGLPGGAAPLGTLRTVSARLADAGATVHLRTAERALLTMGAAAPATPLLRSLGLPHVHVESVVGLAVAARHRLLPIVAVVVATALVVLRRRQPEA